MITPILLEGKPLAEKIKTAIAAEVAGLKSRYGRAPKLVAIQVGEHPSSAVYIKSQRKAAEAAGIEYELKALPAAASSADISALIKELNIDPSVSAIIMQLPLPNGTDAHKLVEAISPAKDAEGMHPANLGKIISGACSICPCTAAAVMALLETTGQRLYGKEAVIIGHSEIVGKPIALMLLNKFATTTVCHIATGERGLLPEHCKRAEVLIVAVGKAGIIKGEWIREGAIVIDVGVNRVGNAVVGDVEFNAAVKRASYITPVPGGVGPLTTIILMRNTLELYKAALSGGRE